jgi:hypothetical protein
MSLQAENIQKFNLFDDEPINIGWFFHEFALTRFF